MKFSILFSCLLFALTVNAQSLSRGASNNLELRLPDIKKELLHCDGDQKIQIKLLKNEKDENELTCSAQVSWRTVFTKKVQILERYIFKHQEEGIYKVEIEIPVNCPKKKTLATYKIYKILASNILNEIDEEELEEVDPMPNRAIMVYPNPTENKIWISLSMAKDDPSSEYTIQLLSSLGQIVQQQKVMPSDLNNLELDVSKFPTGQYSMLILQNGQILSAKKIAKIAR